MAYVNLDDTSVPSYDPYAAPQGGTSQGGPVASAPYDPWGSASGVQADPYGFVKHHFSFMDPTTQNLEMIYGALADYGVPVKWATRAQGKRSDDKFYIGDTMYDWLGDVGGPNAKWYGGVVQPGGGSGGGGNAFSDPATAGWEALLRQVSEQLSMPQQMPGYANLQAYLNEYMKELQGQAYTPGQSELIQTQAIDPMTQTRDAQREQILRQAAARGLGPSSGPVQQMLADLDRQYGQSRTQVQSGFATHAIGLEKQQRAQAAQVGQMLQALEQGQQTGNEQRALQAVGLMGQLPALADRRLGLANQTLGAGQGGMASLLSFLSQAQGQAQQQGQYDDAQQQAYMQMLGNLIAQLFA